MLLLPIEPIAFIQVLVNGVLIGIMAGQTGAHPKDLPQFFRIKGPGPRPGGGL
jgi:hypothetical protein